MGTSGSKKNKNNNNESKKKKEDTQINKTDKINESIKINETKNKNNRIKERIIKNVKNALQTSSPFEKIDPCLSKVSRSICKIKIETLFGTIKGTGFLLAFEIDQERFFGLVSNEHVINKKLFKLIKILK